MKLKTSYFNESIVQKNIIRFAPLWGIYLVMGVLITLFISGYSYDPNGARFATAICEIMPGMAVINFGYAAMCALALFGDLHKTRMCYSLHAMPMRREGWFLTNAVSGLLFSLVPNLIITVIMLFRCVSFFYVPLAWLLLTTLGFVCFFGIALFCMHITGKGVAAVGMYFLINEISMVLYGLTELYFARFWYGVIIPEDPFALFSTMSIMSAYLEPNFDNMTRSLDPEWINFGLAFLWAGVGIVFAVLALLVYRKRHLESAGEFITLRPAAPVVLVLYALGVGGVLWAIFSFNYGVLLVGLALGFFTGRMLLQRTVKVFSKKNFLGYGILVGSVLLSIFIAKLDPIGITRWVPDADEIESVQADNSYRFYGSVTLEDPEDIQLVRQLHSYAIEHPDPDAESSIFTDYYYYEDMTLSISYTLKSGFTAQRSYGIPLDSEGEVLMRKLYSQPEFLFNGYANDAQELQSKASRIVINYSYTDVIYEEDPEPVYLSAAERESLILALEQDWLAGNMAQDWRLHQDEEPVCSLELGIRREDEEQKLYGDYGSQLYIYADSEHTVTWLKEHGYLN